MFHTYYPFLTSFFPEKPSQSQKDAFGRWGTMVRVAKDISCLSLCCGTSGSGFVNHRILKVEHFKLYLYM